MKTGSFYFILALTSILALGQASCTGKGSKDLENEITQIHLEAQTSNPAPTEFQPLTFTPTPQKTKGSNSSSISPLTSGKDFLLQQDNFNPINLINTFPSQELEDNRIGAMWVGFWQVESDELRDVFNEQIFGLGLKRVRLAVNSGEQITNGVQAEDMSKPEMSIHPEHDELFTMISDAGVEITYILTFWDKEGPHPEDIFSGLRFQTDYQVDQYLKFVQFIVSHFKGRVVQFEIWNEPNLGTPGQGILLDDYIKLVEKAVPVIREEFPEARIQVGGTTPLIEPDSKEYLFGIIQSEIMPIVDVISWHPMYGASPRDEYFEEYYYNYPTLIRSIKSIASAHGFTGEFSAEEMTWWIEGESVDNPYFFTPIQAAKYYSRAIIMNLGLDVNVILGGIDINRPVTFSTLRNICSIMAGHESIEISVEIETNSDLPLAYAAFRYPNGDRILAVWTDGVAKDDDEGVLGTIKLPGLEASSGFVIDVLNGVEQKLIIGIEDENTIIEDLLIKDYPILIRLSNIKTNHEYREIAGDGYHQLGENN